MKRFWILAAVLVLLLTACGPKAVDSDTSSSVSSPAGTRPPTAGDLLNIPDGPDPAGASSSAGSQPVQEEPAQPDPQVLAHWREDCAYDMQLLGQSLLQLADAYDMTVYSRWPDGREQVRVENTCLFFTGPATQKGSVCAAISRDLPEETTVDALREQWGETLTFRADDPLAGPCWAVTDGNQTYRFRTNETGETLLSAELGGNLVLSRDPLLPATLTSSWIAPADTWVELWAVETAAGWEPLLPYARALGSSEAPEGASEPADQATLDYFYAQQGVLDPDTGVQYLSSYSEGGATLCDSVVIPAKVVFGHNLPTGPNAIMTSLDTPFNWSVYNMVGYWFYVDQYKIYLASDRTGTVDVDSYFLITWGDNAGP